jgi:cyclopropane fatty-acyl-phospholipid synthase-like methyltransferase
MSNVEQNERFERFAERYASGDLPWDGPLPPPEVMDLARELPAGRLLDLGCGHGRASIYLAQRGWTATAIDFVPRAIEGARERAAQAGVLDRIDFQVASVLELDHLQGPYNLALDVGCFHVFEGEEQARYVANLRRLLPSGERFVLYSHLQAEEPDPDDERSRPTPEDLVAALKDGFTLDKMELGVDTAGDEEKPWRSGWFWWTRV